MVFDQSSYRKRVIITGRPGSGKTTIVKRLVPDLIRYRPVGFYTEEIREGGERRGFELVRLDGERRLLSHINIKGELKVGKYGVDIHGFEQFLDEMRFFSDAYELVVIDEIGKMECLSKKFMQLIQAILEGQKNMLATVPMHGGDFIMEIKNRPDIILYSIDRTNRDSAMAAIRHMLSQGPIQ